MFAVLSIEIVCIWFSSLCLIVFAIMSRSLDHLFDDSFDAVPPCDKVKNVRMDLPNVHDISNAREEVTPV